MNERMKEREVSKKRSKEGLFPNCKLWLEIRDTTGVKKHILGGGKVKLLQLIEKTGSIRAAADELEIDFKTAWRLTKEMNNAAEEYLGGAVVTSIRGGASRGGTIVTELGKRLIEEYLRLKQQVMDIIEIPQETGPEEIVIFEGRVTDIQTKLNELVLELNNIEGGKNRITIAGDISETKIVKGAAIEILVQPKSQQER